MPARTTIPGFIGVDLVEIKKAQSFLRVHTKRLHRFLTPTECKAVARSRRPSEKLAILLAAKEAIFKAGRRVWMGPSLFRDIRADDDRFELKIVKTKEFVVVSCHRKKSNALGSTR